MNQIRTIQQKRNLNLENFYNRLLKLFFYCTPDPFETDDEEEITNEIVDEAQAD